MQSTHVPELEVFLDGPSQPGGPDQPGLGRKLAVRDIAVVEGELAGLQVAADQQGAARRGGADPGPGVPPLALRALARGADLPAPFPLEQLLHRFRAGHRGAGGGREDEVRGDAQDVGLPACFQELPQLRAAAVDLIPADEVEPQPVAIGAGEDVDGQLPLRPEPQIQRQACDQRLHRVPDVLSRDPLARPGQRVPGLLPHVGQVHRVDAVRNPARAAHVLPFHPRGQGSLLLLARLVQRAHGHPPAPGAAGRSVQPGHRITPDRAHHRRLVPRRPVQQPLHPGRRPVARLLGDRPPVPRRKVAHQRIHVLPGLQPRLRPREARPDQPHQGRPLPQRPPCPYPGDSSRLVFICQHKHMIPRRLPSSHGNHKPRMSQQLRPPLETAVLDRRGYCYPTRSPGEVGTCTRLQYAGTRRTPRRDARRF